MHKQRIVRLVIVARGEKRLVRRDERQAARISKLDQRRLGDTLGGHAVTLQLDVEAVAEQALQFLAARLRERALPGADRAIERTVRAAAERDQPVGLAAVEPRALDVRLLRLLGVQIGARAKPHQAAVAVLARSQEARCAESPPWPPARADPDRRNRSPARSRRSAECRRRPSSRRIPAHRTCCRCRSAPAPVGGLSWRARPGAAMVSAPSSSENDEWTCRCTKPGVAADMGNL